MICDNCNKFFVSGQTAEGLPNGVKFLLKGEKQVTMCAECMVNLGKMDDEQKDEFFKKLREKKEI